MTAQPKVSMTYAQYLEHERASDVKHEFLRGEVWAMAGGTPSQARLQVAVGAALHAALTGKPCGVYFSDLRVRVEPTDRSTYPDVSVVCGKLVASSDDPNAVTNPVVLVEVLSEGSEASDRGEKFAHYQRLDSLQEYMLISQQPRRIEVFRRGPGMAWTYRVHLEGDAIELTSLGVTLQVNELYADPNA